jgi:hypothetical protein
MADTLLRGACRQPGMTMAMQPMPEGLGIKENDIRSEEFYGY